MVMYQSATCKSLYENVKSISIKLNDSHTCFWIQSTYANICQI